MAAGAPQLALLLRGINLGPNRRVGMADLRALLTEAGYDDVRTLLQSGNVILRSGDEPDDVARAAGKLLADRSGFDVDVLVRTERELARIVEANPLGDVATDGSRHFVAFLSQDAAPNDLAPASFEPERLEVRGREAYVWCPDGLRDSRLMKALDRKPLAPVVTVRNWNTVTKVLQLMRR
jgi:uncharacterized protein (DUF1697 family)